MEGKNRLVNSLFHSHSTRKNVGKPIRLHCAGCFVTIIPVCAKSWVNCLW